MTQSVEDTQGDTVGSRRGFFTLERRRIRRGALVLSLVLALALTRCGGPRIPTAEEQFYAEQRAACTRGDAAACDRVLVLLHQRNVRRGQALDAYIRLNQSRPAPYVVPFTPMKLQ